MAIITYDPAAIDAVMKIIKQRRKEIEVELNVAINRVNELRAIAFQLSETEDRISTLKAKEPVMDKQAEADAFANRVISVVRDAQRKNILT